MCLRVRRPLTLHLLDLCGLLIEQEQVHALHAHTEHAAQRDVCVCGWGARGWGAGGRWEGERQAAGERQAGR